jgi:hypothetical protein
MDQFLIIATLNHHMIANRTCAALEDAGIPVMLEHVEIEEDGISSTGYRVLVPSQHSSAATRLVNTHSQASERVSLHDSSSGNLSIKSQVM